MSYIFCNINRAKASSQKSAWAFPKQSEEETTQTEFWVGDKVQERQVIFLEYSDKKDDESRKDWSFHGEIFLLNSQKQNFLQNVKLYLLRITFWFRPVYAVQLGVRFAMQALTGDQDNCATHTHLPLFHQRMENFDFNVQSIIYWQKIFEPNLWKLTQNRKFASRRAPASAASRHHIAKELGAQYKNVYGYGHRRGIENKENITTYMEGN